MKKINILYWSFTIPFAVFMLSSAIPNMLATADWVGIFKSLGYPEYMVSFIGVAKLMGVIGILVPGFPRITEWAYAGLAFDVIGATYSVLAVGPLTAGVSIMGIILLFLALSYIFYHKRLKMRAALKNEPQPYGTSAVAGSPLA